MRATMAAAVLIVTASIAAPAQTPATETVKAELRAFIAELNAARESHDRAALERLYAPEFLYIHALGAPVDRPRQIAEALAAPPGAQLPVPSFDGLMVIGDVAILRQPVEGRFGTSIFTKASGHWQLLQMQGTPIPSTLPKVTVTADVLRSYAGRYQQDNGNAVTIAVEGDGLTMQVHLEGRQKLQLTTVSATQFALPAGAGQITFTVSGGSASYVIRRPNSVVITGTRQ
jgi:hypothetical protein